MSLQITIGNTQGQYFRETAFSKVLRPLAEAINRTRPLSNVTLWYDPKEDYHHLEFDLDGDRYDIRYYKILSTRKLGPDFDPCGFPLRDEFLVEDFFISGRYKTYEHWKKERKG